MPAVEALEKHFDKICNDHGPYLRYRVGMIYPNGEAPSDPRGTIEHKLTKPSTAMVKKFYLPARNVQLGSLIPDESSNEQLTLCEAEYSVPPGVRNALYGELLLAMMHAVEGKTRPSIYFGRFGEDKPFTFNVGEGKYMILLRIYRSAQNKFNPIYIRVEHEDEVKYSVIDLEWKNNIITVSLLPMEKSDVPEFLVN